MKQLIVARAFFNKSSKAHAKTKRLVLLLKRCATSMTIFYILQPLYEESNQFSKMPCGISDRDGMEALILMRQLLALLAGLFGLAALIAAVPLVCALREPFVTWYYPIAWYGLILFLDSIRTVCGHESLIFHRPFKFAALCFWSAVIWFLFEAFNFRLANWYYVFVSDDRVVRFIGSWLSFGTVLPALFLIEQLLDDLGLFKKLRIRSIALSRARLFWCAAAGTLCLLLPMLWPRFAFPLIWIFGFLLPLPLFARRMDGTWVDDLMAGQAGRVARILLAGLFCGVIWEFLNYFAVIRWIYTVPFLEELKFFEMPPLGFLGFLPFALECVVLYGVLAAFSLAPEVEQAGKRKTGARPRPAWALFAAVIGLFFGIAVIQGMVDYSIDSYTPRPAAGDLPTQVAAVVGEAGNNDCFALRRKLEKPNIRDLLQTQGVDAGPVIDWVDLALLRGIGTEHARRLAAAGVRSTAQLAQQDPDALSGALAAQGDGRRDTVRKSRIRVWIRAARRISDRAGGLDESHP